MVSSERDDAETRHADPSFIHDVRLPLAALRETQWRNRSRSPPGVPRRPRARQGGTALVPSELPLGLHVVPDNPNPQPVVLAVQSVHRARKENLAARGAIHAPTGHGPPRSDPRDDRLLGQHHGPRRRSSPALAPGGGHQRHVLREHTFGLLEHSLRRPAPEKAKAILPPRRTDCRPENRDQLACEAEAGKVILFESWLRHEVPANPTDGERVSVSFNYTWV